MRMCRWKDFDMRIFPALRDAYEQMKGNFIICWALANLGIRNIKKATQLLFFLFAKELVDHSATWQNSRVSKYAPCIGANTVRIEQVETAQRKHHRRSYISLTF